MAASMSLNQEARISPDVLFQEVGGEAVLLDLKSESYFGLNEVGTRIWQLIEVNGNLTHVLDIMLDEYDVAPERMEADLMDLVGRLTEAGLVTLESANAPPD